MKFFQRRSSVKEQLIPEIEYSAKSTVDLSEEELGECSELFSTFYGKYSSNSAFRPGQNIKMGPHYYAENYCKENFYVALARHRGVLVGQAFYIRKNYAGYGMMTWVLQLVVNKEYRKQGIASTLLRSIWGFSDDYAWGLATANPCTVKTLESATFRKCRPLVIKKNLRAIKLIGNDTTFVKADAYSVTNRSSQVNTQFFVDNSEFKINDTTCDKYLGELKPGYEWLAFTFQKQAIQMKSYKKHFDETVAFSEKILKEAYSRMDVKEHSWAKGTQNEVDFILEFCDDSMRTVLDIGCGIGRHSIELAKRGYEVCGIDFSKKHIAYADKCLKEETSGDVRCRFVCTDVRSYQECCEYDIVICLYDVIGSFPDAADNFNIIKSAYSHLKNGGIFILSVMNMELTEHLVPKERKANLKEYPEILLELPPSQIMQKTGDIFDPDSLAIDTKTNLVYRKEQFVNDSSLSAEYVIRDKRYTMDEIVRSLMDQKFDIVDWRYVRAGHFNEKLSALDPHAKEICVVARK